MHANDNNKVIFIKKEIILFRNGSKEPQTNVVCGSFDPLIYKVQIIEKSCIRSLAGA